MLLQMHRGILEKSWPDTAGRFLQGEVRIADIVHRPPYYSKVQEQLYQAFASINDRLFAIKEVTPDFFEILQLSAEVHYLVAQAYPFEDGKGGVARAKGDYAMLAHDFYYDVILQV